MECGLLPRPLAWDQHTCFQAENEKMHLDRKQSLSWARDSLSLLFLSSRSRAFSTKHGRGPAENCGAVRARAEPAAGSYRVSYVTRPSSSPPPPHGAQLLASCHTAHKASYHFAEIAPDELPFPFSRGELPAACWQTAAVDWHFLRTFLSFYLPYSVAVFFFHS